ncbi:MAG TPA: hypothetical protein PKD64_06540 [Pirellulaceae bacterium]|nr:hypothetical protein [Pirellulaceae bacterium]HMO91840.1 hypothetical protein [Pirellulaceae bacterium]HMP69903.1 hypothetical protein [Pirellulaceae bacterium]
MIFVECPACEEQFQIADDQLGQSHVCPDCRRSFEPQQAVTRLRDQIGTSQITEISETVSRSIEPSSNRLRKDIAGDERRTSEQPPPIVKQTLNRSHPDSEIMVDSSGRALSAPPTNLDLRLSPAATQANSLSGRIASRSRSSSLVVLLFSFVGLVTTLGVLMLAIYFITTRIATSEKQLNEQTDPARGKKEVDTQGFLSGSESTSAPPIDHDKKSDPSPAKPTSSDHAAQDTLSGNRPPAIGNGLNPDELPETFTLPQFREIWDGLNSYVVNLEIKNESGTHYATGLIIDSRGWVATSALAIEGAIEVRVSLAARSLDSGAALREMSDISRGVISRDAARDIAIIGINRDLVLNFTDVKTAADATIIPGQRVISARTPPLNRRSWFVESRVDRRVRVHEILSDLEKHYAKQGTSMADDQEVWFICKRNVGDSFRGAIILNDRGEVIGMNTGFELVSDENSQPIVPISSVLALKDRSSDTAMPFRSTPANAGTSATTPRAKASDAESSQADSSQSDSTAGKRPVSDNTQPESRFPEINDLRSSARLCNDFNFVARTDQEIQNISRFVHQLKTVIDYTDDTSLSYEDKEDLEKELQLILKDSEQSIGKFRGVETRRIRDMNEMMLMELGERDPLAVALVCTVVEGAASSPRFMGKDTVILNAAGADRQFFVTLGNDSVVLRPGSTFLLLGFVDPSQQMSRAGGAPRLYKLDLLFGSLISAYGL